MIEILRISKATESLKDMYMFLNFKVHCNERKLTSFLHTRLHMLVNKNRVSFFINTSPCLIKRELTILSFSRVKHDVVLIVNKRRLYSGCITKLNN